MSGALSHLDEHGRAHVVDVSSKEPTHRSVEARDRTGVELEAITAATIGASTVYDMLKAVDPGIVVDEVKLLEKHGGRSGSWVRGAPSSGG